MRPILGDIVSKSIMKANKAFTFSNSYYLTVDMFNSLLYDASVIINNLTGASSHNFAAEKICNEVHVTNLEMFIGTLSAYLETAKKKFSDRYAEEISKISKAEIKGKEKILTEISNSADIVINYIKTSEEYDNLYKFTGFDFKSLEAAGIAINDVRSTIIKAVTELKTFILLMTGYYNTETAQQMPVQQPAPASQQPNPMPMNMVSTPIGASPFIVPIQQPVPMIPEYLTNPDIARHFVIGNTLYIPDINEQYKFRDVLLSIVKNLDDKKDDSVFVITRFNGAYDWAAEKIDPASGMVLNSNSVDYENITYYPDGRAELSKCKINK